MIQTWADFKQFCHDCWFNWRHDPTQIDLPFNTWSDINNERMADDREGLRMRYMDPKVDWFRQWHNPITGTLVWVNIIYYTQPENVLPTGWVALVSDDESD